MDDGGEVSSYDPEDHAVSTNNGPEMVRGNAGSYHYDAGKASESSDNATPYAKGGEVEDEGDDELHEGVGKELMEAIHSKDHKKLMSGLEAMVLHHMSKRD
jgi:hypothetical protein